MLSRLAGSIELLQWPYRSSLVFWPHIPNVVIVSCSLGIPQRPQRAQIPDYQGTGAYRTYLLQYGFWDLYKSAKIRYLDPLDTYNLVFSPGDPRMLRVARQDPRPPRSEPRSSLFGQGLLFQKTIEVSTTTACTPCNST